MILYLHLKEKFEPGPGFEPQICSLALYHLSYPDSIGFTVLNHPLESNDMQVLWSVTLSLVDQQTNFVLLIYSDILKSN